VLVIDEGNGARQILGLDPGAIRAAIDGVVDEVHLSDVSDLRGDSYSVSY
jgi:microcompartment protein CcmK/EutM